VTGAGAVWRDVSEAIDDYRRALQLDPDCARAHHLLGLALVAKGRRDEADDCYPEGVKSLLPARGDALRDATAYYVQTHDYDPDWVPARNPLRIPPQDERRRNENFLLMETRHINRNVRGRR